MGLKDVAAGARAQAARRGRELARRAGQRLVDMSSGETRAEESDTEAVVEAEPVQPEPVVEEPEAEAVVEAEPVPVVDEPEAEQPDEAVGAEPEPVVEAEPVPVVDEPEAEQPDEAVGAEPEPVAEQPDPVVEEPKQPEPVAEQPDPVVEEPEQPEPVVEAEPEQPEAVVEEPEAEAVVEAEQEQPEAVEAEPVVTGAAAVGRSTDAAVTPRPAVVPSAGGDAALAPLDQPGRPGGRRLIIAALVVLAAAALLAVVAVSALRDGDEQTTTAEPIAPLEPTSQTEPDADAPAAVEPDADPAAAPATPEPTAEPTTEPTTEPTPEPAPEPTPQPAVEGDQPSDSPQPADEGEAGDAQPAGEVPESRATVLGGKIYLEGAVPDEESARAIVELAAAVLGPENVVNNYIIDPRAGDPNLGNVQVDDPVLFETGSAVIAPEFEPLLNQALALMALRPSVTLTIIGHTDSVGPDEFNMQLSLDRAGAVVSWLTTRGVDPARLSAEGRGESEPVADNDTALGRALNRRIQVIIENLLADA